MRRQKNAFTLIELIVVLIILGVLAGLALPAYFSWVQRADAAKALATINGIKSQLVPCLRSRVGDPNIGCTCIGNVYPHEISDMAATYGACDPNSPQAIINYATQAGFQNSKFVFWMVNRGSRGFDSAGYVNFINADPQAWTITAYYYPDGNVHVWPGSAGLYITGPGNDTGGGQCYSYGGFAGIC